MEEKGGEDGVDVWRMNVGGDKGSFAGHFEILSRRVPLRTFLFYF